MLELTNARIGYGPVSVVHDLTISVGASEAVFLVGPNGAGKSTTLRGIIGHNPLTSGAIMWEGRNISKLAPHERARLGIALVPEGRHVFPHLTVLENLEVAARVGPNTRLNARIEGIFDRFPRLAGRRGQRAGLLSGGEQQMLAIGRALVQEPRLLVIDELSLGLAPVIYQQVGESVRDLARDGLSVLLVEQNAVLAMKICSRGYLLSRGTVVLEGTVEELKTKSEMRDLYLGGLGKER